MRANYTPARSGKKRKCNDFSLTLRCYCTTNSPSLSLSLSLGHSPCTQQLKRLSKTFRQNTVNVICSHFFWIFVWASCGERKSFTCNFCSLLLVVVSLSVFVIHLNDFQSKYLLFLLLLRQRGICWCANGDNDDYTDEWQRQWNMFEKRFLVSLSLTRWRIWVS